MTFDGWTVHRDAHGHVRIVYRDIAALELSEDEWAALKAELDG